MKCQLPSTSLNNSKSLSEMARHTKGQLAGNAGSKNFFPLSLVQSPAPTPESPDEKITEVPLEPKADI